MEQAKIAAYRIKYAPKTEKKAAVSAWKEAVLGALNG